MIHESPTAVGQYSFAHALIRETIYEQISLTRRAQLHRRIGEAIEGALGDAAQQRAGSLAYHFSAAGDVRKAYEYHSTAAAAAALVYAVEPALAHYTAALEAGAKLGLEAAREPALRGLLLQRGKMRWRTGDVSGARRDLEAALDAAQRAGDRASELEALNELGIVSLRSDLGAAAARTRRRSRSHASWATSPPRRARWIACRSSPRTCCSSIGRWSSASGRSSWPAEPATTSSPAARSTASSSPPCNSGTCAGYRR